MSTQSLQAFNAIREHLTDSRKRVYDVICELKNCTFYDVAEFLGVHINTVSPRCHELFYAGYLKVSGTVKSGNKERQLYAPVLDMDEVINNQNTFYVFYTDTKSDLERDHSLCETETGKNLLKKRIDYIDDKLKNLKEIAI